LSLTAFGLALAFASALTSAFTHALLKSVDDKLAQRVWSCLVCAAAALPLIAWTGPLPERFWLLLAAFAVVSATNQIILVRSYEISDFSAAYPVARGVVPLATTIGGIVLLGDRLSVAALSGVVAITAGVLALALGKGMSRSGWIAAISTGITTIGYNLLAAHGIRDATDPINFLAWLYIFDATILPLYLLARAGNQTVDRLRKSFRTGLPAGLSTLFSYSALTFAMRYAPVGAVSAIRESSVLIGLALAAVMLKERLDSWRIGAGLLIAAGAAAIVLG
jgi:drug/metabolite transporter (DMT)-like permease